MNNKRLHRICFFPFIFFLCVTHAFSATLVVPDVYQLIKINGKDVSSNFFSNETTVKLKKGENVLTLQYSELFEDADNDDHVTIKSEPQVVLFTLESGLIDNYFIVAPTLLDDAQARKYAEEPLIEIKYEEQTSGELKSLLLISKGITDFEAGLIFTKMDKLHTKHSKTITNGSQSFEEKRSAEALEQLKSWWNKADKEQRRQFILYTQQ